MERHRGQISLDCSLPNLEEAVTLEVNASSSNTDLGHYLPGRQLAAASFNA
jgi:hypothetical protein